MVRLCAGAKELFVAAPYIKAEALTRVLADVDPEARVVCVTRWNPHDLLSGSSDLACRRIVLDRGGSFSLHPFLHAKYYRIDDAILIGSANVTSSGLGWSRQSNLEILCHPGADFDPCFFEHDLLMYAREIDDEEFSRWESMAGVASERSLSLRLQPRLDTWRPATRDPANVVLAYRGREEEIASYDEQRSALRDLQALAVPRDLTDDQLRSWSLTCLLALPFTGAVIRFRDLDASRASRRLADAFGLGITEARRDMEAVQSWLVLLSPKTPSNDS